LKVSQWLGLHPQTLAFVNSILLLELPSKNPGYTPDLEVETAKHRDKAIL